jgi:hypothetical protein
MRERVFLFGDVASRPEGLERALVRAGFALAEAPGPESAAAPDLALVAVRDSGCDLEGALAPFNSPAWAGVPVFVLLPGPERDGISRALALGAVDALAAPVDLGGLCARLEARCGSVRISRAASASTLPTGSSGRWSGIQPSDGEILVLVQRLGELAFPLRACGFLPPTAAMPGSPRPREPDSSATWRWICSISPAAPPFRAHGVRRSARRPLPDHLAQWPDSPGPVSRRAAHPPIGRSGRAGAPLPRASRPYQDGRPVQAASALRRAAHAGDRRPGPPPAAGPRQDR